MNAGEKHLVLMSHGKRRQRGNAMADDHLKHSEVAAILQQIEVEYRAARQGFTGFAVSATHAAISARLARMGQLHEHLRDLVGDDAICLVVERLEACQSNHQLP